MHGIVNRLADDLHHTIRVGQYRVVPEPEHLISPMLEKRCPLGILAFGLTMLAAIRLDNQPRLLRDKIRDIRPDGDLSAELDAQQVSVAQARPKTGFRRCLFLAQRAGEMAVFVNGLRHRRAPGFPPHPANGHPLPRERESELRHASAN